jgi:ASC-1-like (ASCH) protein
MGGLMSFQREDKKRVEGEMEKYKNRVNQPGDVWRFIESRVRELEADENFKRILEELKKANWNVPRGFSASSVREDRDNS